MYESPMTKIINDIQTQMIRQEEENIMLAVNQSVGYVIEKPELIKALNYDRGQYKKGYTDALQDIREEIKHLHDWAFDRQWILELIDRKMDST